MTNWTGVARVNFLDAFESFWPCTKGQEDQRGGLLGLIEGEVNKWPVDVVIKGLRQCKVTENANRVPSIQRILECIRSVAPKYQGPQEREEYGISWEQFVKTNDWPASLKRCEQRGLNQEFIRKALPAWRQGAPLVPSLRYLAFNRKPQPVPARTREPGED